jgi:hypothetical protein
VKDLILCKISAEIQGRSCAWYLAAVDGLHSFAGLTKSVDAM